MDVPVPINGASAAFPEHSVHYLNENVIGDGNWSGHYHPEREWPAGSVAFMPGNSDIFVRARNAHVSSLIMLKPDVFYRAAEDAIDYSAIDFRYGDITSPATSHLTSTMLHLTRAPGYKGWPLLLESASVALAVAVIAELSPRASMILTGRVAGIDLDRKRRVMEYMESNMHRQMTLAELAGVAAMSTFHFARSFKQSVGETPLQYLARRRVEEAKKLLRQHDIPLAAVAHACGYASQSHMNTVFKKVVGTSPGRYRRDCLTRQ